MTDHRDAEKMQEIVERIMTQHWDMKACDCWICVKGREAGCHPMSIYLRHNDPEAHYFTRVQEPATASSFDEPKEA